MARQTVRVVAAVAEKDGRYLITQRRPEAVLGTLWEFPGGRVEEGEMDEAALERELAERLGVGARIGRKLGEKRHAYQEYDVSVALYEAIIDETRPLVARRVHAFRWVASAEFDQYRFPAADQATMDQLLGFKR